MSCNKCGCKLHPCRCIFDNDLDFFKYGEVFLELDKPKINIFVRIYNNIIKMLNKYP